MNPINSKQLYYFTVVSETGSFTAAAKKLGISQPPLSKQIMLLEEEMGVKLLERRSKKAELTEAGTYLYFKAKDILSMMGAVSDDLKHFPSSARGVLKLGTISSSGTVLLDFLKDFTSAHPGVRFEVTEGNTYELLEKMKNGLVECSIIRTPFNPEGLECVYGKKEPIMAVGNPVFFPEFTGNKVSLTELKGKPLIYYRRFDSIISLAFQNSGIKPDIFCRNDDARTCLQWAKAGMGIALVPQSISLTLGQENLLFREIDSSDTVTQIAAVYKKNGYVSNIAREFVTSFGNQSR
ncbi:LysR family transcriptional regulator [Lacrimispora amygdalina]|uniref:LysR family transcriptional regulator n=1 Tax=Lacrimispora amygdalina TaxID=253257 RepID=UPI000BE3BB7A|nr:LysR family transcriptional regulator [Lacrimispora amygdalina]